MKQKKKQKKQQGIVPVSFILTILIFSMIFTASLITLMPLVLAQVTGGFEITQQSIAQSNESYEPTYSPIRSPDYSPEKSEQNILSKIKDLFKNILDNIF